MVAFPLPRSVARSRRKLIAILNKVAEDLLSLGAEVNAVLQAPGKKGELSPAALTALARLAHAGSARVALRLAEMGGGQPAPAAGNAEDAGPPGIMPATINNFILTYRRCGRRLCLALAEARQAGDGPTVDLLFHLLRDLERQLWLVDSGRGSSPADATAGAALGFCSAG